MGAKKVSRPKTELDEALREWLRGVLEAGEVPLEKVSRLSGALGEFLASVDRILDDEFAQTLTRRIALERAEVDREARARAQRFLARQVSANNLDDEPPVDPRHRAVIERQIVLAFQRTGSRRLRLSEVISMLRSVTPERNWPGSSVASTLIRASQRPDSPFLVERDGKNNLYSLKDPAPPNPPTTGGKYTLLG